eukprot:GHVR01029992.1.p1 GENE.GHVR01029992.1~~GHVR01029992.1.p1  ORF type:complete len:218 (-),score=68.74 GHVR01029992.1:192-845(-)
MSLSYLGHESEYFENITTHPLPDACCHIIFEYLYNEDIYNYSATCTACAYTVLYDVVKFRQPQVAQSRIEFNSKVLEIAEVQNEVRTLRDSLRLSVNGIDLCRSQLNVQRNMLRYGRRLMGNLRVQMDTRRKSCESSFQLTRTLLDIVRVFIPFCVSSAVNVVSQSVDTHPHPYDDVCELDRVLDLLCVCTPHLGGYVNFCRAERMKHTHTHTHTHT